MTTTDGEVLNFKNKDEMVESIGTTLAMCGKGEEFHAAGNFPAAILAFDEVINKYGDSKLSVPAMASKGDCLTMLKRFNEALDCFDKALKLDPKHTEGWYNKGNCYTMMENYAMAIDCYDEAIELDRSEPDAWFNKGFCLQKLGRHREAQVCFDKSSNLGGRGYTPRSRIIRNWIILLAIVGALVWFFFFR